MSFQARRKNSKLYNCQIIHNNRPKQKEEEEEEEDEEPGENLGTARKKGETAEERKQRKASVKDQRKQNRQRKKALKTAFKTEENIQHRVATSNPHLTTIKVQ